VAAIALPVGIAYASLAGVPVEMGIYAAIFPLFGLCPFRLVAPADHRPGRRHLPDVGGEPGTLGGG